MEEDEGISAEDVADLVYEDYLQALYATRAEYDPHQDWEGFADTLWPRMIAVFDAYELVGDSRVPEDVALDESPEDLQWLSGARVDSLGGSEDDDAG